MNNKDFTATLLTLQTPSEAYDAILNVPEWWTRDFEGSTQKLHDVFTVRFGEVYITMEVVELVAGRKITWLVTDCNKPWLQNTKEWNGTRISWKISDKDGKTQVLFTHLGLVPEIECFEICSNAWDKYLKQSLYTLITKGVGQPDRPKAGVAV